MIVQRRALRELVIQSLFASRETQDFEAVDKGRRLPGLKLDRSWFAKMETIYSFAELFDLPLRWFTR